jgi:hypothetical protein
MPLHRPHRALSFLLLAAVLGMLLPAGETLAQHYRDGDARSEQRRGGREDDKRSQPVPRLSPRDAAVIAQSRYGGKVLKITPAGKGYRVRLLQDNGRVITVTIGN